MSPITSLLHLTKSRITTTSRRFSASAGVHQIPRAYLTVAFFNERFEYVSEGSIAVRVSQSGDGAPSLVLSNIKAPKNGYAYIYLSNENDDAVYFDNFTVSDTRGRIIEEDHYYPFGLKIAGISSTKLGDPNEGSLKNNNLYNDKELFDDADLDWYDYGFRNYDPQIGRFTQLDPLTDEFPELTNYQYASNDPILNIDLDGLEGVPTPGGLWNGSFLEATKTSSNIGLNLGINAFRLGANTADRKATSNTIQNQIKHSYALPLTGVGGAGALEGAGPFALFAGSYQIGWNYGQTHADQITTWVTATAAWFSKALGLEDSKPIAPPLANANRKDNPDEHILYTMYGTTLTGEEIILKYGISDYTRYKLKRPESQNKVDYVNSKVAPEYRGKIKSVRYTYKMILNRSQALSEELLSVTLYFLRNNGNMPAMQLRPAPMKMPELLSGTEW